MQKHLFIKFLLVLSLSVSCATLFSQEVVAAKTDEDGEKYATLYIYRPKNSVGGLVGYNISVNDSVVCKLKNGAKHTIRLYKEGPTKIWPNNEDKKLSVNLKFGGEYYIRFAMISGLVGARPELSLISPEQGKDEFTLLEGRKTKSKPIE